MSDTLMKGSDVTVAFDFEENSNWNTLADRIISFDATPQIRVVEANHLGNSTITTGESFAGWKGSFTVHIPDIGIGDIEDYLVKRARRIVAWKAVNIKYSCWESNEDNAEAYNASAAGTAWSRTFMDVTLENPTFRSSTRDGFVEFSASFTCADSKPN